MRIETRRPDPAGRPPARPVEGRSDRFSAALAALMPDARVSPKRPPPQLPTLPPGLEGAWIEPPAEREVPAPSRLPTRPPGLGDVPPAKDEDRAAAPPPLALRDGRIEPEPVRAERSERDATVSPAPGDVDERAAEATTDQGSLAALGAAALGTSALGAAARGRSGPAPTAEAAVAPKETEPGPATARVVDPKATGAAAAPTLARGSDAGPGGASPGGASPGGASPGGASPDGASPDVASTHAAKPIEAAVEARGSDAPEGEAGAIADNSADNSAPTEAAAGDAPSRATRAAQGGEASAHGGQAGDEPTHGRGEESTSNRASDEEAGAEGLGRLTSGGAKGGEPLHAASTPAGHAPLADAATTQVAPTAPADRPAPLTSPSPAAPPPQEHELPEGAKWRLVRDAAGQEHARVTVEHPTLGTLQLDLHMAEAGVDVHLVAPSLVSALRLERDEDRIRALLEERGARLAALRVNVDGRREPGAPAATPRTAPRTTPTRPRPRRATIWTEA